MFVDRESLETVTDFKLEDTERSCKHVAYRVPHSPGASYADDRFIPLAVVTTTELGTIHMCALCIVELCIKQISS